MTAVHATLLPGPDDVPPALFVHGVLSWGSDPTYGFGAQRPLAAERTLLLLDRRGHGGSPDLDGPHTTDYAVDAQDVIDLLDEHAHQHGNQHGGVHLVGHSYGAVGAMLAAAERPDLVRSLCLIQPGALRAAEDEPVVAEALRRNRSATASLPPDLTPEDYLRLSTRSVGMPTPDPTPQRLRAARAAMGERPCWDADTPLAPLADAAWPALVVRGDWSGAPDEYRRLAGEPLMAAAAAIAGRIGAELLTVPGFYPHVQHPGLVNDALAALWRSADQRTTS